MSTLKIAERVVIQAPVDRVFAFLIDPERVVQCLPGATYDGKESDTVFLGHIKVKVGPVSTLFASLLASDQLPKAEDISLRLCNSAGEALPEDIARRWRERG